MCKDTITSLFSHYTHYENANGRCILLYFLFVFVFFFFLIVFCSFVCLLLFFVLNLMKSPSLEIFKTIL